MACASKVTIEIDSAEVPLLEGALELAEAGMLTSGDKSNRSYVGSDIDINPSVNENILRLLFDPQTAGGMFISVPEDRSQALLARLLENYPGAKVIGKVKNRSTRSMLIR